MFLKQYKVIDRLDAISLNMLGVSWVMTTAAPAELNLRLAWERLQIDRKNQQTFTEHPFLLQWISSDLDAWIAAIEEDIRDENCHPRNCLIDNCPKPYWLIRPGATLDLRDEVVYNAIMGLFHEQIYQVINWSQGDPDIAYQINADLTDPKWLRDAFLCWKELSEKSIAHITDDIQYVVVADVTGFYENVDLDRLYSDLNACGVEERYLKHLIRCLKRWAEPRGKGIPQGFSASDILAKVYMHPVDQGLRDAGFQHLRYVDDFRIFCRSKLQAKLAIFKLNSLLRNRGLNLQSAKTKILAIDEARQEFDGVIPLIDDIKRELITELEEQIGLGNPYVDWDQIEALIDSNPDFPRPEVIKRTFHQYFLIEGQTFDKTLFHFLLTKLRRIRSRFAVSYCLDTLSKRPEETKYILRYLGESALTMAERGVIIDYIKSSEAIYDYQLYLVVKWFYERSDFDPNLIPLCRQWAFDRNRAGCLRSYCLAIIGRVGNNADSEAILDSYALAISSIEKAEIIMALSNLEGSRRNAFYGRVKTDGDLVRRAIALSKK